MAATGDPSPGVRQSLVVGAGTFWVDLTGTVSTPAPVGCGGNIGSVHFGRAPRLVFPKRRTLVVGRPGDLERKLAFVGNVGPVSRSSVRQTV